MANVQAVENCAVAAGVIDEEFSDFTIVCGGKEFKVHRVVISRHSKYFKTCCLGQFKEAQKQRIELKGDPVEAVERMIKFFYTFNYNDQVPSDSTVDQVTSSSQVPTQVTDPTPTNEAEINAWMYSIADKYEIPPLKALAIEKFWANTKVQDASHMLGAAYTLFKHAPVSENDDKLKDMFLLLWMSGGKQLVDNIGTKAFLALSTDVPEFSASYIKWITSSTRRGCYSYVIRCHKCNSRVGEFHWEESRPTELNSTCKHCGTAIAAFSGECLVLTPEFRSL